jgi:hypothetical protein
MVGALLIQRWQCQKAERAKPIVDRHHHHAPTRQSIAFETRQRARTLRKAAAMEPDHDWQLRGRSAHRRPDVEIQAILALSLGGKKEFFLIE